MTRKEEIKTLAKECLTENFEPKACGREKCIQLINAMNSYYGGEKFGNFGNPATGFMNIWAMKMTLYSNAENAV